VSPLVAVDLSDGNAITVTADHPFWLGNGAQSHTGRGRSETLAVLPPKGGAFICHLKSDSPPTPFL